MAQILVRDLDDDLKHRLRRRAAQHGHSMEEEVRIILQNALLADQIEHDAPGFGTESAALFQSFDLPKGTIRELRDVPFTSQRLPFKDEDT